MDAATLQVTLAPNDVRHARHTLPHELRVWGPQVEEVLLVLDTRESNARSRQEQADTAAALTQLREVIAGLEHPGLRVVEVDRSTAARAETARAFGTKRLPMDDFRGRPYYTYLHGLALARNPLVLHLDSDMLFGGGSPTWIAEARERFAADETLIACNPLPGPPLGDGQLRGQDGYPFERVGPHAYRFDGLSTRVFLAHMPRLRQRLGSLAGVRIATLRSVVGSALRGQQNWMPLESRIALAMEKTGSHRLDFLGEDPGMWSLHPNERGEEYHAKLEALVALVESGDPLPEQQRGHYDLQPQTLDALP